MQNKSDNQTLGDKLFRFLFGNKEEYAAMPQSNNTADEEISCPECAATFKRLDLLNNNCKCPNCGTFIQEDRISSTIFT